jgi:acetyl esterase/lipase
MSYTTSGVGAGGMKVLVIVMAASAAFIAVWIVVPAPRMFVLPLGVGAPEVSPLLLAAAIGTLGLTFFGAPSGLTTLARLLAVAAGLLSAWPLLQVRATVREFDRAITPAGSSTGPAVSLIALVTGTVTGVDAGEAIVSRGLDFGRPDGQALTIDVYRPRSKGVHPVLVQIYGGAWQRGQPGDDSTAATYFASRGWVVFAIDYRHAPRWRWPAQRDDVRAALAWIRANGERYGADPSRMALVGRSAGAQLALIAAYEDGTPAIDAVVACYGPTDLAEGWRLPPRPDPLGVRGVLETYIGGTPDDLPEAYRAASPIHLVSATAPPTLLLYGSRDHIVEARFGRALHERLQASGATSVLLELPWSEHAFDAVPFGLGGQISLHYMERFLSSVVRSPNGGFAARDPSYSGPMSRDPTRPPDT